MSLTDARLNSLVHELTRLRGEIAGFRDAVRTISIGIATPAGHERALLRDASLIQAKLTTLRPRLDSVAAQLPELSRAAHRGGSTSAFGHLGNVRGHLPMVEQELAALETELQKAQRSIASVMNDPKRTPGVPTGGVTELIDMALELTTKVLERVRAARR